ncbi:hypothetical protein V1514DRAFT_338986 [Lipomyces japonicus]|uniref:uncharacterized protein n=1 Tax=Lipomyces japonicus TaxID=56871 RepID=UPI0034CD3EB5
MNLEELAVPLRAAILNSAAHLQDDDETNLLQEQIILHLHEESTRLQIVIDSLDRQYELDKSADQLSQLISQLEDKQESGGPKTNLEVQNLISELINTQRSQISTQANLLRHYTALLNQSTSTYAFPNLIFNQDFQSPPVDHESIILTDLESLCSSDESLSTAYSTPELNVNKLYSQFLSHVTRSDATNLQSTAHIDSLIEKNNSFQNSISELQRTLRERTTKEADQEHQLDQLRKDFEKCNKKLQAQSALIPQIEQRYANEIEQLKASFLVQDKKNLPDEEDSIEFATADPDSPLQLENDELRAKVYSLSREVQRQTEEHASEFKAILLQNASLNEKLAQVETKKFNYGHGSSDSERNSIVDLQDISENKKVAHLQKEMQGLLQSYETLMTQSLQFETERDRLIAEIDHLRGKNENLEAKILDNRVKLLANNSNGHSGVDGFLDRDGTSLSVMRKEFRKLVSEIRNDHAEAIKAECEERRRLEKVIRNMKRGQ